jgi:hypothetical protein
MKPPAKMGRPFLNNVTVQARIPAAWMAKISAEYPAKTAGKSLAKFIQAKITP